MTEIQAPGDANIVSKSEFAKQNGWAKSYVSKLVGEGRLVLTEDGKVMVAESLERIQATTNATDRASAPAVPPAVRVDRDRKEFYDAENARLDLEERTGRLLAAQDVVGTLADAAAMIRATLEAWPDDLAPDLAALGGDEARIRAHLLNATEVILTELATRFGKLASQVKGKPVHG